MSSESTFRERLLAELHRRRSANPRYSLRAFARAVGVDHSTLSQMLRGRRRLTARAVRRLGARLALSPAEIACGCAIQNDTAVAEFVSHPEFRPDSRWIAMRLGIPLDEVNVALQRLLRMGRLSMDSRVSWTRLEVKSG